ncbi:MAG: reductive dehalogenase, partial [Gammaproteobacteria bacterium]|nr:reductive dehalogenase [Gammaproteobacteria bacterium]
MTETPREVIEEQAASGERGKPFCGFESIGINRDFQRFEQRNDIFCRGFWDEKVINPMTRRFFRSFVKPADRSRDSDGFTPRDFALRNGPWVVTETLAELHKSDDRRDGFWDDFSPHIAPQVEPPPTADAAAMATEVKQVARLYGADLVGITDYDERFTYASRFSARGGPHEKPMELPAGLTSVIVIAKAMDYQLIRTSPSA